MKNTFPDGVWPTMITPFTQTGDIDYTAVAELIEWYIKNQVNGIFAVCQSSEIFYLSLPERIKLAVFINEKAAGRLPIIASGHISDSMENQINELGQMAETGVDAVILITNRLAQQNESDNVWINNLDILLKNIPVNIALGLYECPFPYKRIVSPQILKKCMDTGRFFFLKDTSCDVEIIKERLELIRGSDLKIYNANTSTLLDSLKLGVVGYSGVMANFHPDLYVWLMRNWMTRKEDAVKLSNFLSIASLIEKQLYPVNAKYYLSLEGHKIENISRSKDHNGFTATNCLEILQLHQISKEYSQKYQIQPLK